MTVNCYGIYEGPRLVTVDYPDAIKAIRGKSAKMYIDIVDGGPGDLEQILDDIDAHGLIRRFCLESRNHPGFYPLKPLALIVLPIMTDKNDSGSLEYLSLLYCQDFLITIRSGRMHRYKRGITSEDSVDFLTDDSTDGMIASLMIGLSLDALRKTARQNTGMARKKDRSDAFNA